jgi:hypothetical protein
MFDRFVSHVPIMAHLCKRSSVLYEWVGSDTEFTTALGMLNDAQKNDPLKTGTDEDTFVNAMMIALVLLETKDRKLKNYQ